MLGIFQSTPAYAGDGQPSSSNGGGAFGWLTGLFAFPGTPSYQAATPKAPTPSSPPTEQTPTDGGACASSSAIPMAIVIQRAE